MGRRSFLLGAGVGAGLMYFFDPIQGDARRRRARERTRELLGEIEGTLDETLDETEDATGNDWRAERAGALRRGPGDADVVGGRSSKASDAGSNGTPRRSGDIPGLELSGERRTRRATGALARLTERAGTLGVLGGALAAYGIARRGRSGRLLRAMGVGLLVRGLREAEREAGARGERRRVIDVQHSVEVAAPAARVFEFLASGDNFARFLGHARETRDLGGGRTRWRAETPAGEPVEWTTVLVEYVPDRLLAWRSEPRATVRQSGVVRLAPTAGGGTNVHLRLCYGPSGDAGGPESELFGTEPGRRITDDLQRLRALLETPATAARQGDIA